MGIIYATTMDPTKTELLTAWLPGQDFFVGTGIPQLETLGGFRLEDPAGEVGMEFILAVDRQDAENVLYHLPLSYRGAPIEAAEEHLLGTSEHGVLGLRYIYDAAGDPVWQQCVRELFAGRSVPQHQNDSDTSEPRVVVNEPGSSQGRIEIIRRPVAGTGQGRVVIGVWQDTDGIGQSGPVLRMA
ncbi:hypothetical protein OK351_06600 [Glutamicibacter sp. MNS18]|uniref:maltokinase N-terminal cap-like domain-containing protein n=1 Tax=Glutamicibacter sp. MNS18 TaxID=2989817 RepID=UPI0022364D23|nr:hypothetical protein [Glutamicibacter sp. MNS18]MCW4465171.1 hypothetical protein [Glutamicibacter sp. MNS18]